LATYQHTCRQCGITFEAKRSMLRSQDTAPCPRCGAACAKDFTIGQIMIPARFRRHVSVTGLKDDLGSGPGLDVNTAWGHRGGTTVRTCKGF
jgi:putative FmdB family regulatory protein